MDEELLKKAADALKIRGVFLRSSNIQCRKDFFPPFTTDDDLSLLPQYRVRSTIESHIITPTNQKNSECIKTAVFLFETGIRLVDNTSLDSGDSEEGAQDDKVYVEIDTEFCAHYEIDSNLEDSELHPALEEFGRYNIGYHVWPYWREYVQSTCTRLNIPPIPVPMYRIPKERNGIQRDQH
jgi:hypothetical protein